LGTDNECATFNPKLLLLIWRERDSLIAGLGRRYDGCQLGFDLFLGHDETPV
jgi:hypothetical protein